MEFLTKTAGRFSLRVSEVGPLRPSRCAVLLATVCVLLISAGADQPPEKNKPSSESRKLVLFNGKTLDGWKKTRFGGEGEVKVKDGTIIMRVGASLTGITNTRKDLPKVNYQLSYEAMRLDGYDFFAAVTFPVGDSHLSFLNGGWGGSVTGLSSIDGRDASENETGKFYEYKDKRWYKFCIRITDERIRCLVDGEKVVDAKYKGRRIGTRIEADLSKPLGFATWETSGAVRKIEIRTLTPAEVAQTNKSD